MVLLDCLTGAQAETNSNVAMDNVTMTCKS